MAIVVIKAITLTMMTRIILVIGPELTQIPRQIAETMDPPVGPEATTETLSH
jgi:hypothetical protein